MIWMASTGDETKTTSALDNPRTYAKKYITSKIEIAHTNDYDAVSYESLVLEANRQRCGFSEPTLRNARDDLQRDGAIVHVQAGEMLLLLCLVIPSISSKSVSPDPSDWPLLAEIGFMSKSQLQFAHLLISSKYQLQ